MFALVRRVGGIPVFFHPLRMVGHHWAGQGEGGRGEGSQGVSVASSANTQLQDPGLKALPQFPRRENGASRRQNSKARNSDPGPLTFDPTSLGYRGAVTSQTERRTLDHELLAGFSVSQGSHFTTVIRKPCFGQQRATVKLTNVQVNPEGLLLDVRGKWPMALGRQVGKLHIFFNLRVT